MTASLAACLYCVFIGILVGIRIGHTHRFDRIQDLFDEALAAKDGVIRAKDDQIRATERLVDALKERRAMDREALMKPCEN